MLVRRTEILGTDQSDRMKFYDRMQVSFDRILAPYPDRLTPKDIQDASRRYFPKDSYLLQVVLPTDQTVQKAAAAGKTVPDE